MDTTVLHTAIDHGQIKQIDDANGSSPDWENLDDATFFLAMCDEGFLGEDREGTRAWPVATVASVERYRQGMLDDVRRVNRALSADDYPPEANLTPRTYANLEDGWHKISWSPQVATYLHLKDGAVHHDDDYPAIITMDEEAGQPLSYRFLKNGVLDREEGAAVVRCDRPEEEGDYYRDGKLHRENGPARTLSVALFGGCKTHEYWLDGVKTGAESHLAEAYDEEPEEEEEYSFQPRSDGEGVRFTM